MQRLKSSPTLQCYDDDMLLHFPIVQFINLRDDWDPQLVVPLQLLPKKTWLLSLLAALPVRLGGLGIQSAVQLAQSSFLALISFLLQHNAVASMCTFDSLAGIGDAI